MGRRSGGCLSPLRLLAVGLCLALLATCTTYGRKVPAFKLPAALPNMQEVAGAQVAARDYPNRAEASDAFGFNIVRAGLLPVQVVFDNRGPDTLQVNPAQTFLIDEKGEVWPALDNSEAYKRVAEATHGGRVAGGAVRGGLLGGATGAFIGTALGIITGADLGIAAAKGAAAGGAIGGVAGGAHAYDSNDAQAQIASDLRNRSLKNKPITSGEIAYGFIFFPAEAGKAKQLRLQLQDARTGKPYNLSFAL
jgi:hypothetical protein